MQKMGIAAVAPKPKTTVASAHHKVFPYLLRNLDVTAPNQVWCSDITYVPLREGFMYLAAVMDWASRFVRSWRLSNCVDVDFCLAALDAALSGGVAPGIFNTDQGTQFTSTAFTERVISAGARVSMDGRGRWLDNVFIERPWRSLKCEALYLHEPCNGSEAHRFIGDWMAFYNNVRPHSALGNNTPRMAYQGCIPHLDKTV